MYKVFISQTDGKLLYIQIHRLKIYIFTLLDEEHTIVAKNVWKRERERKRKRVFGKPSHMAKGKLIITGLNEATTAGRGKKDWTLWHSMQVSH